MRLLLLLGAALLAYTALDRQKPCLTSDCDSNLGAGLVAATAGLTLMTPLGVHLADSRRGSFLSGLLFSAAGPGPRSGITSSDKLR
jgi:hypothetical protein